MKKNNDRLQATAPAVPLNYGICSKLVASAQESDFRSRPHPVHHDPLPEDRTTRCQELLRAALALTDDLLRTSKDESRAALLGSKGDGYCFVAIERNTKFVLNLELGRRTQATTDAFIERLPAVTSNQPKSA